MLALLDSPAIGGAAYNSPLQGTSVSEPAPAWYSIPAADALTALRSASSDLTEQEVQARLLQSGPNRLPEPAPRSPGTAVRGTRVVWLTVIAVTAAQFAVTYLPPLQPVFGTASVPFLDGVLIFAVGMALFATPKDRDFDAFIPGTLHAAASHRARVPA